MPEPQPSDYRYRISSTGYSSRRYGPCEVCGKHASEVFIQVEEQAYKLEPDEALFSDSGWSDEQMNIWLETNAEPDSAAGIGWTQYKCYTLFGHQGCLLAKRRTGPSQTTDDRSLDALRDVLHAGMDVAI